MALIPRLIDVPHARRYNDAPMTETPSLLSNLNKQQQKAVTAGLGQTLVLAGPGSGKTRVLTSRIAYLIQAMGVHPTAILAVTFTNKAAREMEARLQNLLEGAAQGVWLGTFHAMCARILRRETNYLPYQPNFVIMDADDQETLTRRVMKELRIDDKIYRPTAIHASISTAKNELILPEGFPVSGYRDEITARVYKRYQEMLLASNAMDFDDLMLNVVRLLQDNLGVQERYARRFEHVLVDEFQDTNIAQYTLLRLLSSVHKNIFVVGDEDQSIYRWRGADYRNVLRFEEDYPACCKILLEQNYRSTQTVLDAARAVIDRNKNRTPKHLFSERGTGDRILLFEASDDHAEAAYVVDTIHQLLNGKKANGGDFAVMYRTNAQSRLLEEAFLHAGLAYRLVGAQRFYGRREVKDIIAYLRLVQNPDDEVSLARVLNVPLRGIGDKTLIGLQLTAQGASISAGAVLLNLAEKGQESPYHAAIGARSMLLAEFGELLLRWRSNLETIALPTLFDRLLADIGYAEYIRDGSDEGEDRWENVQELRRLAFEYEDRGLTAFLENLALVSDQDTVPEKLDTPTLLTLHAAKGLEFDTVFIIGLDEGLVPHSRSFDEPEEMAEERRLFYVGMTRARNRLFLVRANQRTTYGSFEMSDPSRFLADLPEALVRRQGMGLSSRTRWTDADADDRTTRRKPEKRWETSSSGTRLAPKPPPSGISAPVVPQRYRPAMHVRHASWGEGMVIESRPIDGEETVDVVFKSVGFKRVLASIAHLEIIDKDQS